MRDVSPTLLVDLYEVTMAVAYWREGMAPRPATFSLFVRALPPGRGYLVAAGLDDALRWLEEARFSDDDLAVIQRLGLFDDDTLRWLGWLGFSGSVRAVPEGTIVFPDEPLLEVDAPIAEAQLAETFLLNQVTLQTTLATKAARLRHAAGGKAVVDFALRRAHGIDAGMKLARVARLTGLDGTSNIAGSARYRLPASGTMAHAFIQAYPDETDAFRAFARAYRERTVLLVDTYDTERGVERAIQVARELRHEGVEIRAIRLDSGDLGALARHARRRLDDEDFPAVGIFASGGLDEYEIHRLLAEEHAPIDGFGVGSSLGVSDDAPTLDSVYKLVAYDGRPVRKTSTGKATWPGRKQVWRPDDWSGDRLGVSDEAAPAGRWRPLLVEVMRDGRRTEDGRRTLEEAHQHFGREWQTLPEELKDLRHPGPYPVEPTPRLRQMTEEVDTALGEAAAPGTAGRR